jgi:hypothetical protein
MHERKIEQLAERKIAQASTHNAQAHTHNAKTHASVLGNEKLISSQHTKEEMR